LPDGRKVATVEEKEGFKVDGNFSAGFGGAAYPVEIYFESGGSRWTCMTQRWQLNKKYTPESNRFYRQKHSAAAITNQGESELKIVIEHFNAGKKACGVMGRV
jgi:hypothetical protein